MPDNLMQYLALGIGATELTAVTLCVSVSAKQQKSFEELMFDPP